MLQLQLYAYLMSGCVSGGIQENDHVTVDRLGLILAGILDVTLGNLEHMDGVFHTLIRIKARNAVSIGFCYVAGNVRAELNRDTLNGIAVGVVYQHAVALQAVGVAALRGGTDDFFPFQEGIDGGLILVNGSARLLQGDALSEVVFNQGILRNSALIENDSGICRFRDFSLLYGRKDGIIPLIRDGSPIR